MFHANSSSSSWNVIQEGPLKKVAYVTATLCLKKNPSERASMLEVPLFLIPTFIRRRRITPDCETTS